MRTSAQEGDVVTLGPPRWNGLPSYVPEGAGRGQQGQVPPDFWNPWRSGSLPGAALPQPLAPVPGSPFPRIGGGAAAAPKLIFLAAAWLPRVTRAGSDCLYDNWSCSSPLSLWEGGGMWPDSSRAPPLRSLRPRPTLDPRVKFLSTSSLRVPTFLMSSLVSPQVTASHCAALSLPHYLLDKREFPYVLPLIPTPCAPGPGSSLVSPNSSFPSHFCPMRILRSQPSTFPQVSPYSPPCSLHRLPATAPPCLFLNPLQFVIPPAPIAPKPLDSPVQTRGPPWLNAHMSPSRPSHFPSLPSAPLSQTAGH